MKNRLSSSFEEGKSLYKKETSLFLSLRDKIPASTISFLSSVFPCGFLSCIPLYECLKNLMDTQLKYPTMTVIGAIKGISSV